MAKPDKLLLYFADPMCSWCWGFTPVIDEIKAHFGDQLQIALVLGGLRPGTTEPIDNKAREEILHHWHEVHKRSGQPFQFEGAMADGFIYDTEPPSRAVVTMGELKPEAVLTFFKMIQAAFYADGRNVTQRDVLSELAGVFDINEVEFTRKFDEVETKQKTLAHFNRTRQFGVRGFPTLVLQNTDGYLLLTHGYQSFQSLQAQLEKWIAEKV
ncbi:DsbA family protein [Kaarinaea lacus]